MKMNIFNRIFSDLMSPMCTLSNRILTSILSIDYLNILTNALRLNNKYDQSKQQDELYERENIQRQNDQQIFILSSPEITQTERSIINSLHSSLTNGDSIFTEIRSNKLPQTMYDNVHFDAQPSKNNEVEVEPDVDLENQYYNSKALKEDDPCAALASFTRVLELEAGDKGEWGFKALKQMIKINFKLVSKIY